MIKTYFVREGMSSSVYIIAGPNGAGKTPFAREFLPNYVECKNFINADLIAQGVSPFSREAIAFRAGRLMLGEISSTRGEERALASRQHFRGRVIWA
jgi:predicted ABC-type ATPase